MPDAQSYQSFFWPSVLLCLGIYVITFVIRTFVETLRPNVSRRVWWRDLLLPFTPILAGVTISLLADKYPWPTLVANSFSAKLIYGSVCGICSGWVYARFRTYLKVLADKMNSSESRPS